jgi:mono/diheme cytochrome c family protein
MTATLRTFALTMAMIPATFATALAADAVAPEIAAEAKTIYDARCALCHGATGKGDGVAAAGLSPQPRDLTSAEWQTSVTDEYVETIIKFGGSAVGKSAVMPPNPDLQAKDDVVKGLRALVRGFGGK